MPTLSSSIIPVTKSWDEFEEITRSCLKIKWNSPNLTRVGRPGQPQDGVDIYGEDHLGQNVGVQCKLVQDLSLKAIQDEVTKADNFTPPLSVYYIATTAPSHSFLQKEIRILSKERVGQNKFAIGIFFWNDLIQELLTNVSEFQKHFPQFTLNQSVRPKTKGNRQICLLHLGFFGVHIQDYMKLLFNELSWEPEEFSRLITDLEASIKGVIESNDQEKLVQEIKSLSDYVLPFAEGKEERPNGWSPALKTASSIENKLTALEYGLDGKDLVIFKLGQYLGNWNHAEYQFEEEKKLPPRMELTILSLIKKLSHDGKVPEEVVQEFTEYRHSESIAVVHTPHHLYNRVRTLIYNQILIE